MRNTDDFWDLAELIPKKKKAASLAPRFGGEVKTAEIQSGERESAPSEQLSLTGRDELTSEEEYRPADNPLLYSVKLVRRDVGYSFYGQFRKSAVYYFDKRGEPVDYVPFFSYIPQYSQLSEAQLAYYLYFRDSLRIGETPRTDYSYFWLYIYEILNLPDLIPPSEGVLYLCRAWSAYRTVLPKIDKYMTVWLADYCLVHRLPCPLEELRSFLGAIMENGGFREFYLGGVSSLTEDGVSALIGMTSDYRCEKSRFAVGEHADLFRRHVFGVMTEVFRLLFSKGDVTVATDSLSTIRRDAFVGAISSHRIKCSLEIEYASFSTSAGLRAVVTAALKYAENRLRAFLSVKSRLSVPPLVPEYRKVIDAYFDRLTNQARAERAASERPSYEVLYEAESKGLSFDGAAEIEALSWENARLLASDEDLLETDFTVSSPKPTEKTVEQEDDSYGLGHADAVFLHAILLGDTEELSLAVSTAGVSKDGFAERINEAFSEYFGDVVLELNDDGYIVIEDYIDEVMKWTEKHLGKK